jgi:N-acetylated-alpha-linked acidic dipeptidase
VDLAAIRIRLAEAGDAVAALTAYAAEVGDSLERARPVNDALLRIGRELVNVIYSREGRFRQDPALGVPLLPDFAAALEAEASLPAGVVRTELMRARNRLEWALITATEAADAVASPS